jgi:predicted TIM-barrel fold metal-dependent hydrolase
MTDGWTDEWISKVQEPALDPTLPIIDCHHHVWTDAFALYVQHFGHATAETFLDGVRRSGHNITATVHLTIQADYRDDIPKDLRPIAETEYLARVAHDHDERRAAGPKLFSGIVGGADMLLGTQIDAILDAHLAAAPARFRGIRYPVAWHPSPLVPFKEEHDGLLAHPEFVAAARRLAARDLSLDVFVFYNQLPQVVRLAQAVPELRIALNHTGGLITNPAFGAETPQILHEWRDGLKRVAAQGNVSIKLGGLAMAPLAGARWTARPSPPTSEEYAAWMQPHVQYALECFGPARAMFESNFPPDRPSANYGIVWNAFKRLAANLGCTEKDALFRGTAADFYRIEGHAPKRESARSG